MVINECILIITGYTTLVNCVLLKPQLGTIKLVKIKKIARSKFYQENTKYVRKSHTQQIEGLKNKVESLTSAMKQLILRNEEIYSMK